MSLKRAQGEEILTKLFSKFSRAILEVLSPGWLEGVCAFSTFFSTQ